MALPAHGNDPRGGEVLRPPLLVSACLVGLCTRFDGGNNRCDGVVALGRSFVLVPVCPEQFGGLPTPREPAEIQGGDGREALAGRCRVATITGENVTAAFARGAGLAVAVARLVGAGGAVLKARSPSCGVHETYDGSFSRSLRAAPGVAAAALEAAGCRLWTEEDVAALGNPAATIKSAVR